jgi:Flp pilus assembly protein TadD
MSKTRRNPSKAAALESLQISWMESLPTFKILVALSLLILLAYANSLHGEFVFDDSKQILNNPTLRGPVHLFEAFTTDVWAFQKSYSTDIPPPYYRPFFTLWLSLGYHLFRLWTPGWHLLSVLLHLLASWLVFVTIRQAVGKKSLGILAAALFAVHPIHSESVSWVSAVPDVLLAVFFLPAIYFYLQARESGRLSDWGWSLFFFALSTLCKENALSLPFVVLGLELLWPNEGLSHPSSMCCTLRIRAAFVRASGFIIVSGLYLLARYQVLGLITWKHPFDQDLTGYIAWITVPRVLTSYLRHLVYPFHLSLFYDTHFVRSAASLAFVVPSLLLAGVFVILLWMWRKLRSGKDSVASKSLVFGACLLFAPMLPILNLKAFHEEYLVQDRYMYLPSIGFCVLLALLLLKMVRLFRRRSIPGAVVGLILVVLLVGTARQNMIWGDSVALWTRAKEHRPNSWHAHYNLGLAFLNHRRFVEAEQELLEAAKLAPDHPTVFNNLGLAQAQLFKNEVAVQSFERAIQLAPTLLEAYVNLGDLQYRLHQVAAAEISFRKALELDPQSTAALFNLAHMHGELGRSETALWEWKRLLELNPDDAEARWQMGRILKALNRPDEARIQWQQALRDARRDELRQKIRSELEAR